MASPTPNTSSNARHAVARSTGATTYAAKGEDGWNVTCLNHGSVVVVPNRQTAWVTSSHPQDWCAKCKALAARIAAGKAQKIIGDKLMPAKRTAKKTAKPAASRTATRKPTPKASGKAAGRARRSS